MNGTLSVPQSLLYVFMFGDADGQRRIKGVRGKLLRGFMQTVSSCDRHIYSRFWKVLYLLNQSVNIGVSVQREETTSHKLMLGQHFRPTSGTEHLQGWRCPFVDGAERILDADVWKVALSSISKQTLRTSARLPGPRSQAMNRLQRCLLVATVGGGTNACVNISTAYTLGHIL